jgi:hypothetical protein
MKATKTAVLLLILGGVFHANRTLGGPVEDLASPSQETRDRAAKGLRETSQEVPGKQWDTLMSEIKEGDTKAEILERLKPFHARAEMGLGSGGSHSESYRLDDYWLLRCTYRNKGEKLIRHELVAQTRHVWVQPPDDFTGLWTTYFVNGRRSHEIQYQNGKNLGTFTSFRGDGSIAFVQNYTEAGIDGEDLGFFPSGKIMYRAHYRAGKPVGTWTWYHEDGTVRSTREHPALPK